MGLNSLCKFDTVGVVGVALCYLCFKNIFVKMWNECVSEQKLTNNTTKREMEYSKSFARRHQVFVTLKFCRIQYIVSLFPLIVTVNLYYLQFNKWIYLQESKKFKLSVTQNTCQTQMFHLQIGHNMHNCDQKSFFHLHSKYFMNFHVTSNFKCSQKVSYLKSSTWKICFFWKWKSKKKMVGRKADLMEEWSKENVL